DPGERRERVFEALRERARPVVERSRAGGIIVNPLVRKFSAMDIFGPEGNHEHEGNSALRNEIGDCFAVLCALLGSQTLGFPQVEIKERRASPASDEQPAMT